MNNLETVQQRFPKDVEAHIMYTYNDDGTYRHLRFKKPGTMMYHFDLVTWPGFLAITGDMGTYVFSRIEDMFDFFRSGKDVNVSYWIEKCQSYDRHCHQLDWDSDAFEQWIDNVVQEAMADPYRIAKRDLRDFDSAIRTLRSSRREKEEALEALTQFYYNGWISDYPEDDFTQPGYHLLWCLHAIRWGIEKYDEVKSGVTAAE